MTAQTPPFLSASNVRAVVLCVGLVITVVVAYALGVGGRSPASAASTAPPAGQTTTATGVEVVGTGKVAGTPDVLRLDLEVSVTRGDASGSLSAMSSIARKVIEALKSRDVDAKDIKTANLSLQPEYDYSANRQILKGYTASEQISVVLRDLKKAGAAIGAASATGGDAMRIQGVALDLEGDSDLLTEARAAAIADARSKAETYAKAAGRSLGAVTVISENTSSPEPMRLSTEIFAASPKAADVPVEPGSQQVAVSVRVVWSFA